MWNSESTMSFGLRDRRRNSVTLTSGFEGIIVYYNEGKLHSIDTQSLQDV